MLVAELTPRGQRLVLRGPYAEPARAAGRAGRETAIRQRMQWFASGFERFLRERLLVLLGKP